jgi:hypothetical protein
MFFLIKKFDIKSENHTLFESYIGIFSGIISDIFGVAISGASIG